MEGESNGQRRMKLAGRYEPVGLLAEGGMASVFLAVHHGSGGSRVAAVKVVRSTIAEDNEFQEMFASESELALRLNHPNVIHAYEAGGEGTARYLAMEFLAGHTFAALLRRIRKDFALDLHVHVLREVLRALHYVHRLADYDGQGLGLVHRDVNPSNIFVTYDGTVKLVDFGIAKNHRSNLETTAGVVKGKAAYMAPEQAATGTVDGRTDVFAVGILLWEALTGTRLVHPNADSSESLIRRVSGEEPRVTTLAPDADPSLVVICERAMQVLPRDRYASALAMLEDLERWAAGRPAVVGPRPLSEVITTAFAVEKARVEAKVQQAMAGIRPSQPGLPTLFPESGSSPEGAMGTPDAGQPTQRARGLTHQFIGGVVAVVLATAIVALFVARRHGSAPTTASPHESAATTTSAALASPPASEIRPSSPPPGSGVEPALDSGRGAQLPERVLRAAPLPARPAGSDELPRRTSRPHRSIDKEDPYE